jgi:hypothetical protein
VWDLARVLELARLTDVDYRGGGGGAGGDFGDLVWSVSDPTLLRTELALKRTAAVVRPKSAEAAVVLTSSKL